MIVESLESSSENHNVSFNVDSGIWMLFESSNIESYKKQLVIN